MFPHDPNNLQIERLVGWAASLPAGHPARNAADKLILPRTEDFYAVEQLFLLQQLAWQGTKAAREGRNVPERIYYNLDNLDEIAENFREKEIKEDSALSWIEEQE